MDKYSAIDLREMGKSITIVLPSSFSFSINNDDGEQLRTCTLINHKYGSLIDSSQGQKRKNDKKECQCNDTTSICSLTDNSNIKRQKTPDNNFRIFNGKNNDIALLETLNTKVEQEMSSMNPIFDNQQSYHKEKSYYEKIEPLPKSTTDNLMSTAPLLDLSAFEIFDDEDDDIIEIFRTPPAKLQTTTNPTNSNYVNTDDDYICPICNKKCL